MLLLCYCLSAFLLFCDLKLSMFICLSWANRDDVWKNMINKEESYVRDKLYMQRHPLLQPKMRTILLDWLMEVSFFGPVATLNVLLLKDTNNCHEHFSWCFIIHLALAPCLLIKFVNEWHQILHIYIYTHTHTYIYSNMHTMDWVDGTWTDNIFRY